MKRNFKFYEAHINSQKGFEKKERIGYYEFIEGLHVGIVESPSSNPVFPEYSATELETGCSLGVYEETIKKTIEKVRNKLMKHASVIPEILQKAKDIVIKNGGTLPVNDINVLENNINPTL